MLQQQDADHQTETENPNSLQPVLLQQIAKGISEISVSNFIMQNVLFVHDQKTTQDGSTKNNLVPNSVHTIVHRMMGVKPEVPQVTEVDSLQTESFDTPQPFDAIFTSTTPAIPRNPCDKNALFVSFNGTAVSLYFKFTALVLL
jgi:hypothetical protein